MEIDNKQIDTFLEQCDLSLHTIEIVNHAFFKNILLSF